MINFDRRNFMRLTGLSIAGTMISQTIRSQSVTKVSGGKVSGIIYRKLGKTGIELPIVSLPVERIDNVNLVTRAINAGIKYFDTAYSYGNGKSEEFLGKALEGYDRKSLIISTKISTKNTEEPEKELYEKFETSLKRLKTNYVDILFLHAVNDPELVQNERFIKVFTDLKKQGKARFIGVSVHNNMANVINATTESKVWEVILTTYNYRTMQNPQDVQNAIEKAASAGIGIIAMKTMAGVYKDREKTQKINATAALKWALNNQNITTAIPGITSFEQLEEDLKLLTSIDLTEQEKLDLAMDLNSSGLFCHGCNECLGQCKNNIPVPDYMRAYMYAYGYNNTRLAKQLLQEIDYQNLCDECDECSIKCTQHFNVKEKIADISRISNIPDEFLV